MRRLAILGVMVLITMLGDNPWAQHAMAIMLAQGQPSSPPIPPPIEFNVGMLTVEPFEMGDPVENAPYSAEIVNEVTQQLADGNRIERRSTGMVARDSYGRVRREQQLATVGPLVPNGDARMVTISDPVARVHYSLDPVRKVAMRSRAPRPGLVGPPISTKVIEPEDAGGPGVRGLRGVGVSVAGVPELTDVQTEQLGTKEYEGVLAEGTRTTATLPAGAIGNVRPIEIISERWYSTELRVVVFSRRADPRFGEKIYRLTNITRAEPDAALFQVPADYKREDVKPLRFEGPPADPTDVKPLR